MSDDEKVEGGHVMKEPKVQDLQKIGNGKITKKWV